MKTRSISSLRLLGLFGFFFIIVQAAAFYDPNLGRWLNRDFIGERGADGPNLYVFVRSNPVTRIDRDGKESWGPPFFPPPQPPSEGVVQCAERIARELGLVSPFGTSDPSSRWNHCVASCRISRECPGGKATAFLAGWWHEVNGPFYDTDDMAANLVGRNLAGCKKETCEELCNEAFQSGKLYPPPPPPPPKIIPLGF
jgi:hypothetical protein